MPEDNKWAGLGAHEVCHVMFGNLMGAAALVRDLETYRIIIDHLTATSTECERRLAQLKAQQGGSRN